MEIVTRSDLSGGGEDDLLSVLSGIGLLEIVTRPDLSGGGEAADFVREVQHLLVAIGVCSGKMQGECFCVSNVFVHFSLLQ